MLSIPHMIVVFVVVLVVFGPQKLPELARSFGKLMAEFRKASTDFRSAFEDEMRDLERQARIAELKKQAAATVTAESTLKDSAASATLASPAGTSVGTPAGTSAEGEPAPDTRLTEASVVPPVVIPVAESVPRSDAASSGTDAQADTPSAENTASHDQQQPA
ncbi:MAG TPA: twin-arginine translocase TatA/TatE family subunit [Candidatus Acidoferrum sp.]